MVCPSTAGRYQNFTNATEAFDIWEMGYCSYEVAMGGPLLVGGLFYSAVALAIYVRTDSWIMPFILTLIFGGNILGQMLGVVSSFAALLILLVTPLVFLVFLWKIDTRR